MAVLGRLLVSSAERLDLPDVLAIDSYTQGDFKYLLKSFVGNTKPYILKGFDVIDPQSAMGTQNISIRVAESVTYYPGSLAGPFFFGLEEGNIQAAPLVPELRKNSTNFVYLTLSTTEVAKDTRAFWDPDANNGNGGEFTQDVNTQTLLSVSVNVSVSSFPENTVPVCKVVVGSNFIESIEDARDMMFRLGTGGLAPDPLSKYAFRESPTAAYARKETNTKITTALDPNPFFGGDKNIQSLKEWMDVVMTKLTELGGTTYWYEDTSTYSLVNIFKDTLGSSIKSKGTWSASDVTPGIVSWSEDMTIQSTTDKRDIIIRAGSKTLTNNQVIYLNRTRDALINTGSVSVNFINGAAYINGSLGAFENLSKGDWIKKSDDADYYHVRVEEFYAGLNQGGGVTSPSNALSIKINTSYTGVTALKQAVYSKGVYLASEVSVDDRDAAAISLAGGNFYWLAMRSDTVMSVASIVTTNLTGDIENHDGTKARVTSVAHSLQDGQRVTFSGTTNFNGTYAIEVEDANVFYIYKDNGPFADELAAVCHYATVTTQASSTVNGLQLESANHGFKTDQKIVLSGTSNYNGDFQLFTTGITTFTIPVSAAIASETAGSATATYVYVRTDIGPTKLERGESKGVGEVGTENLASFIGMDNDAQTHPNYHVSPSYNTLDGYVDYNTISSDSLAQRASKLTAMMANKAQDKTITYKLTDVQAISNTLNGLYRDISFTSKINGTASLKVIQPSSNYAVDITLAGTLSLAVNQVAYITLDRNASTSIANISLISIANTKDLMVDENIFIFAIRSSDTEIVLWDGTPVRLYSTIISDIEAEVTTFTLPPASSITTGQYFTINSALDANPYYVWFNKNGAGGNPSIIGKIGIQVNITTGDTNLIVASLTSAAIGAIADFSSVNNLDGTITVSNNDVGSTTDAANVDVGGIFAVNVDVQGSGSPLHYIIDGDLLETAIKKLDQKLSEIEDSLPDQEYDELLTIISGAPSNSNELTGPIAPSTNITLPLDSRSGYSNKPYIVGSGQLEVFLNGQRLMLGLDWLEVGVLASNSITFQIVSNLVIGDVLDLRIDNFTGVGGGGGSGEANTASNVGVGAGVFKSKSGVNLQMRSLVAGAGVSIVQNPNDITITSTPSTANANVQTVSGVNYFILINQDVILANNAGFNISVTLPSAIGNSGKTINIKKVDSGNTLSVKSILNQTLDGVDVTVSSYDIILQWESVTVVSDGVGWYIL